MIWWDTSPACALSADLLAEREGLSSLVLALCVPVPQANPGNRLKRSADKLDRVLHAGAIL
jgi:hypothetical protein